MHMLSLSPRLCSPISPSVSLLCTSWPLFSYLSLSLSLSLSISLPLSSFLSSYLSLFFLHFFPSIVLSFPLFSLKLSFYQSHPYVFPFSFCFQRSVSILSLLVLNFLFVFHLPSFSPPASVSTTKLQENGGPAWKKN